MKKTDIKFMSLVYNTFMGLVKIDGKLTKTDFERAKKDYGIYIKVTMDLESKVVFIGGEYHADAEKILLESGAKQENIWGGGINLETKNIDANAIINLRRGNDSTEILDGSSRKEFIKTTKKLFKDYV